MKHFMNVRGVHIFMEPLQKMSSRLLDFRSPIRKIRDIQIVGTCDLITFTLNVFAV